jgi:Uncharacterized secreted protein
VKRRLILLSALLCLPAPGFAALLKASCTVSATSLAFPTYNPFGGQANSSATITVSCNALITLLSPLTVNYSIALGPGLSGSYAPRKLYMGSDTLSYNLYTDPSNSQVWGDGSAGTAVVSGSGTLSLLLGSFSNSVSVSGAIPAGQVSAVPGNYSDTIQVTVSY